MTKPLLSPPTNRTDRPVQVSTARLQTVKNDDTRSTYWTSNDSQGAIHLYPNLNQINLESPKTKGMEDERSPRLHLEPLEKNNLIIVSDPSWWLGERALPENVGWKDVQLKCTILATHRSSCGQELDAWCSCCLTVEAVKTGGANGPTLSSLNVWINQRGVVLWHTI